MPLYEYLEGGKVVERTLPVKDRDAFPNRITVPRRVRVIAPRHAGEGGYANEEVIRGFYREEQKDPQLHARMKEGLGMSSGQIKDAWAAPDPPDPYAAREGIAHD